MSLQNLELTPLIVSELYRDFLVDAGAHSTTTPEVVTRPVTAASVPQPTVKFLGGNQKKITFIVNSPSDVFLPDAHLNWLGKMLEACRLNMGDVAVVNIAPFGSAQDRITIADIKDALHPNSVVLLGTDPQAIQLPLNFPLFNLQPYDGMMLLNTPSPDELNQPTSEAKLLKSKLWVCLQKLFNL